MKKWNMLYDNCRLPIRVVFFAFVLIGIGYLIQNDNVNVFYTIDNPYIILIGEIFYRVGHFMIINMPLIFLVGLVAKRANSGMPAILAIFGYITFLITTMFFTSTDLVSQAYTNVLGLSYTSGSTTYYPLQTGMIGSFAVAYVTRYSYLKSRDKNSYSFFVFANKDTRAMLYELVLCILLGLGFCLIWPYFIEYLQILISWIAEDISDPYRLSVYGLLDRSLSILGLGNIIRYPFWFGSSGGTYSALSGSTILGDVSIWSYMPDALSTYYGAGRFITPYYVINMFACPALYLAMFFTVNGKRQRRRYLGVLVVAIIVSVICGNPLPMELLLLFTSPLLLVMHLILSASLFGILLLNNAFMGFAYSGSTISAMPGSFADFIINIRTSEYTHTVMVISIIGIIFAIIYFAMTTLYYRYLAYDVIGVKKAPIIASRLFDGVGGPSNIKAVHSALFDVTVEIYDFEKVVYDGIKRIGAKSIVETKTSLIFDFGSASTIVRRQINKALRQARRA